MNFLLIFLAKYLIVASPLAVAIFFLTQNTSTKKQMFWIAVGCFPLAFLLSRIASQIYFDPRPFVTQGFTPILPHAPDNGFPSDHALFSSAIAAYAYRFHKKIGVSLFVVALLVSSARVIIGIHSWIDILASFIISIVSVGSISFVFQKYFQRIKRV